MISLLLLVCQAAALWAVVQISRPMTAGHVLYRYFNPLCFFALFVLMFFLMPQVYGLAHDYYMVEFPMNSPQELKAAFLSGQQTTLLFIVVVLVGVWLVRTFYEPRSAGERPPRFPDSVRRLELVVLASFFAVGVLAHTYLSVVLRNDGGFRSVLVKSPGGMAVTVIAYFGGFAVAMLLFYAVRSKRYWLAFTLIGVYGASVVMTGARGRLLLPVAFALIMVSVYRARFSMAPLLGVAAALLSVLVVLDPLFKYFRTGNASAFDGAFSLGALYETRNFDGFSTLALIAHQNQLEPSLDRLFTGIRLDFMQTFFPDVYANGVAFGSTIPGWFLLSGGTAGLIVFGMLYGSGLELLNRWLRAGQRHIVVGGYLFGIVWITAVQSDFVENLDKAIAQLVPALVLSLILGPSEERSTKRQALPADSSHLRAG